MTQENALATQSQVSAEVMAEVITGGRPSQAHPVPEGGIPPGRV